VKRSAIGEQRDRNNDETPVACWKRDDLSVTDCAFLNYSRKDEALAQGTFKGEL